MIAGDEEKKKSKLFSFKTLHSLRLWVKVWIFLKFGFWGG